MHSRLCPLVVALVLWLAPVAGEAQAPPGAFRLEGRWLSGFGSVCDIQPQRSPESVSIPPGAGWDMSATCADLDARSLRPFTISVTNTDASGMQRIRMPLPAEVAVQGGAASGSAYAVFIPWSYPQGFATAANGDFQIEVAPNQTIELLYLMPPVEGSPAVTAGAHGAVQLGQ